MLMVSKRTLLMRNRRKTTMHTRLLSRLVVGTHIIPNLGHFPGFKPPHVGSESTYEQVPH